MTAAAIYIDLALNPNNSWDVNKTYTWTEGGPNYYYYNNANQSWSSQYYRFPNSTNSYLTTQVPVSADGNTPLLPSTGLQTVGIPLYFRYWDGVSNGPVYVINDLNADLQYLQIVALAPTSTEKLVFAPWGNISSSPIQIALNAAQVSLG
jgi:hypothetical protein